MSITTLPPRLQSRIDMTESCWLWTGAITDQGYGRYNRSPAHRVVYLALVGEIPAGLHLDHLCRVRRCVNPQHLEPVTVRENVRRGLRGELYVPPTHCKNGHELTDENTYRYVLHGWRCKPCTRVRALARYYEMKAATS